MKFLFLKWAAGLASSFWPITDSDYTRLRMDLHFCSLQQVILGAIFVLVTIFTSKYLIPCILGIFK